jgi:DNA processing protein
MNSGKLALTNQIVTEAQLREFVLPVMPDLAAAGLQSLGTAQGSTEPDSEQLLNAFLAATFSALCEPGDRLGGVLTEQLGHEGLLRLVIERADTQAIVGTLGETAVQALEDQFGAQIGKLWSDSNERWLPRLNQSTVFQALITLKGTQGTLVARGSTLYPNSLQQLGSGAPHALWARGNSALLAQNRTVALVGSRSTNHYGIEATAQIVATAAATDITVVSGGAFGIDAAAHSATLRQGGQTIAVMAGGVDRLYPRSNQSLLEQVVAQGLVVSEVPPGVVPAKWRFLMRNRLIAALGLGTVVVQAGKTSGSLNTARHALDLSRPVAVVPGPWDSAHSVGCHRFLNEFPGLVTLLSRPADLPAFLGLGNDEDSTLPGLGVLEVRALDTFSSAPMQVWEIQRLSGLTNTEVQIALGSLELSGHISRVGAAFRRIT